MTDRRPRGVRVLKAAARRRWGIWRLHEWRNLAVLGPRVPALRRFEDAEVTRLAALLDRAPEAGTAVVVATYRRPERAVAAVESVLGQTVEDLVVMVVDDGGGLPAGLPPDPRVHAVSLSRNTAVPGLVRNVGIRLTRSRRLAFLDDDNTWQPHHLATAAAVLDAGADLVYTALERHLPDGTVLDTLSRDFDRRALGDDAFVDTNSIVLRRSPEALFSRLPRARSTLPGEDWEFVHRLSRRLEVRHVPVTTVRYLVNPDSFWSDWEGVDRVVPGNER